MMRASWVAAVTFVTLASPSSAGSGDLRFTGACDGSAAVMLDDGRVAVADDEHSLLHIYGPAGGAPVDRDLRAFLGFPKDGKDEADIEGGARVEDRIYWIGSHSHNKNGKARPERQVMFATTASEALTPLGSPARDILEALIAQGAEKGTDGKPTPLATAIDRLGLSALAGAEISPEGGGINFEGLAAGSNGSLLIGFRSPRAGESQGVAAPALIVTLLNPKQVIDAKATPKFGMPIALDLAGLGVRDLLRRTDGSYIVVAGPTDDGAGFALYSWAGPGAGPPTQMTAHLAGLRPEAVVERGGKILLMSDDGDDKCKAAAPSQRSFVVRPIP